MPIKKCTSKGKSGHQYGNQKCYTGKNSKTKARKQAAAIKISQKRSRGG